MKKNNICPHLSLLEQLECTSPFLLDILLLGLILPVTEDIETSTIKPKLDCVLPFIIYISNNTDDNSYYINIR